MFTRSGTRARGKVFWAGLLRASGMLYLAKSWVRRNGTLVLTFHRVLADAELQQTSSLPGMVVRQATFDKFLKYASDTCSFADLNREPDWRVSSKIKLAVTFDDGWSDNATAAYPIARKYQAPIVIFIVADRMGAELPFWPERAVSALRQCPPLQGDKGRDYIEQAIEGLKCLPAVERERRVRLLENEHRAQHASRQVDKTMDWDQIAALYRDGVTFGSHTSTHEILTSVPLNTAEHEISSSREVIEGKLGRDCSLFSYPNGDYSAGVRHLVQCSGYKLAFTNQDPGVWTETTDAYLIPRVNVCEYHLVDSLGNFSPLMFDYAVVWNAAKGMLARTREKFFRKLRNKAKGWLPRFGTADKKGLEKPF